MIDVDANDFVHWLVYDLPAGTTELVAGAALPAGAKEGMASFGPVGYGAPCPPAGPAHEYVFTLYALDEATGLAEGATLAQLLAAMDGQILAQAQLSGMYALAP